MTSIRHKDWLLGFLWTAVSIISWVLTIPIGQLISLTIWSLSNTEWNNFLRINSDSQIPISLVISISLAGFVMGFTQYLIIKQRFGVKYKGWILATTIGFFINSIISVVALFRPTIIVSVILSTISVFTLGASQWFVLRRITVRAGWWVIASAIAVWLPSLVPNSTTSGRLYIINFITALSIRGFIYGLITWLTLITIFRQPSTVTESPLT